MGRMGLGAVFMAFVLSITLAESAHVLGAGQTTPGSLTGATQWVGWWLLTIDSARGPVQGTLSVKSVDGKMAATFRNGPGDPLGVTDISPIGNELILRYEQRENGMPVKAVSTLSRQPDGTLKLLTILGQRTQRGTAKKFTVSEDFVIELLKESDETIMFKKAQTAGLVVRRSTFGRDSFYVIVDPATGIEVLSGRTVVD